jgi:hypothetical protein
MRNEIATAMSFNEKLAMAARLRAVENNSDASGDCAAAASG